VVSRQAGLDSRWRLCPACADRVAATREEVGVLEEVLRALRQVRHGHVQIIIQDARVVQIDRTEKVRLTG
jgi:hypothetical protein